MIHLAAFNCRDCASRSNSNRVDDASLEQLVPSQPTLLSPLDCAQYSLQQSLQSMLSAQYLYTSSHDRPTLQDAVVCQAVQPKQFSLSIFAGHLHSDQRTAPY